MKKFTLFLFCYLCVSLSPSKAQNGLSFDGVNDFVFTNITSLTGTSDRTIEAWIKIGNVTTQKIIVGMGTMPLGTRFTLNVLNGKLRIEIGGGGINSASDVDDNQWHHVAVTYDNAATTKFKLYVDGVLDASGNIGVTMNTSTGPVSIGKRNDNVNYWNGSMDEIRIWNTVRTPTEIANFMNNQLCSTTGLVAYYQLNQGVAGGSNSNVTAVTDNSGNGNSGILNNFSLTGNNSNWVTGVNLANAANTTSSFAASACNSYTAPSGAVYTSSQTITDIILNAAGCDSIMTINLTINSTSSSFDVTTCDSYTAPSGAVYTSSQTVTDIIPNAAGCDSVMTINLTIANSSNSIAVTACDSYTSPSGMIYTTSQVIMDTLTNSAGCDSALTIDLTIVTVDTSITMIGDTVLQAIGSDASYQWIDCDNGNPIMGETSASFQPTTSGNYAVVITTNNGCVDTSSCYTISLTNTNYLIDNKSIAVFPNPSNGHFSIDLGNNYSDIALEVLNLTGQQVFIQHFQHQQILTTNLKNLQGIYLIKVTFDNQQQVRKILFE